MTNEEGERDGRKDAGKEGGRKQRWEAEYI